MSIVIEKRFNRKKYLVVTGIDLYKGCNIPDAYSEWVLDMIKLLDLKQGADYFIDGTTNSITRSNYTNSYSFELHTACEICCHIASSDSLKFRKAIRTPLDHDIEQLPAFTPTSHQLQVQQDYFMKSFMAITADGGVLMRGHEGTYILSMEDAADLAPLAAGKMKQIDEAWSRHS